MQRKLRQEDLDIISQRFGLGHSPEEIAADMGYKNRTSLYRGLSALKKRVKTFTIRLLVDKQE
jgi:hypothetical protein